MATNRTAIVARLQALDAGLEERIARNPDTADPWPEVGSVAGAIRAAAAPQDRQYVRDRIEAILDKHGLGRHGLGDSDYRQARPRVASSHWRAQ